MGLELVTNNSMKRVQKYHRWNPVPKELEQQVIDYYLAENSACATDKKFGVCTQKVLERNNVPTRSKKEYDRRNESKQQQIIQLYKDGKSVASIMKIIGIGEKAVDNCLARNGIQKRRVGWQNGGSGFYRPKSKGKEQEIIAMYQSGISASDTSKVFDVCEATVFYVLRKNRVAIRPPGISERTKARGSKGGLSKNKQYMRQVHNKYRNERRKRAPLYKMIHIFRSRILRAFKRKMLKKSAPTQALLGADWKAVFNHIESTFKEGMTWENHGYGKDKWHVDHKIPLASACDAEHLMRLMHYKNLQALWQTENQSKGGRYAS